MNNLKTKVVHYLMDSTEAYTVIGRVPFDLEPFPGRAILKKEEASFTQILLPARGEDDYEILESMKMKVQSLHNQYVEVETPMPIPMLPFELTSDGFKTYIDTENKNGVVAIGLDEEIVCPVLIDFRKNKHLLLVGPAQRGKTNTLKWILHSLEQQENGFIGIFDSYDRGLSMFSENEQIEYLETKGILVEWITQKEKFFERLEKEYLENVQLGNGQVDLLPSYFIIDGYTRFLQVADTGIQDRLSKLMKKYSHLGFNVIVSGNNAEITKGYDVFTNELKLVRQAIIFMKKSEQTLYTVAYERKEAELPIGFAHYILNGNANIIQIPLTEIEIERKIMQ
jgi:S-DNA-T family DNA segregation ATPase FtsK/SpoIIIE